MNDRRIETAVLMKPRHRADENGVHAAVVHPSPPDAEVVASFGVSLTTCIIAHIWTFRRGPLKRLFAFITMNWRGKPLLSHQVIVQLIGATTTETGLRACCELDENLYPKGSR
jgi:hypothetical protein